MVLADFDIAEHNIQFPFVSANRACVPLLFAPRVFIKVNEIQLRFIKSANYNLWRKLFNLHLEDLTNIFILRVWICRLDSHFVFMGQATDDIADST